MAGQVAELRRRRAEALELLPRELGIAVRRGEMGHQAHYLGGRRRQLRQPVAAHARVELQVDADPLRNLLVGDCQLQAGLPRLSHFSIRAGRAHDQDAFRSILAPKRQSLGNRRHAQGRRPGAERSTCDVDCSVSIAVRLHHCPKPRSVEGAKQCAHIAPESAEIDRDLRTVHQASASGRESMTSEATSPT